MTTIDSGLTTASFGSAKGASTPSSKDSTDYETFLKMLTVQMQNQDPLNPVDSADYAVQLATFSGVEQQVRTNQLLETLTTALSAGGVGEAVAWIGKEARAPIPAEFFGIPLDIHTSTESGADRAELRVTDVFGQVVYEADIPLGEQSLTWAGTSADGSPLPTGAYSFDVSSYEGNIVLSEQPAETYGRVQEVQSGPTGPLAIFAKGSQVALSEIRAVRDPAT